MIGWLGFGYILYGSGVDRPKTISNGTTSSAKNVKHASFDSRESTPTKKAHIHFATDFLERKISIDATQTPPIEALVASNKRNDVLHIFHLFDVDGDLLRRLLAHMDAEMTQGLHGSKSTMAMLPTFVPLLPDGSESGKYLSMDLGGLNLKLTLVQLDPNATANDRTIEKHRTWKVPTSVMHGDAVHLFDFLTKNLSEFLDQHQANNADEILPLGFTFSYPLKHIAINRAELLRWTKGFKTTNVVGREIVGLLEEAIQKKNLNIRVMAIVNDAVGTLISGAHDRQGKCDLGVILGGGTNAAYMQRIDGISRFKNNSYDYDQMVINTEWGAFGEGGAIDYLKNEFDIEVDESSTYPGEYTFDKLVGGACMGELTRLVLKKLVELQVIFKRTGDADELLRMPMVFKTKHLCEILADDSDDLTTTKEIFDELGFERSSKNDALIVKHVCKVITERSARYMSAAIACAVNRMGRKDVVVAINGKHSAYAYHSLYHDTLIESLAALVKPGISVSIMQASGGASKGAAVVAAVAGKLEHLSQQSSN